MKTCSQTKETTLKFKSNKKLWSFKEKQRPIRKEWLKLKNEKHS